LDYLFRSVRKHNTTNYSISAIKIISTFTEKFRNMLSKSELKRYNRHIIMPEIGLNGQQKLRNAKVLVIGAGGLGKSK